MRQHLMMLGRLSSFAVVSIILRHCCFVAQVASTSASTSSALNVDQSVTDKDDFAAWDDDTQKQWKRFMKGSRSQEVCCHMLLFWLQSTCMAEFPTRCGASNMLCDCTNLTRGEDMLSSND